LLLLSAVSRASNNARIAGPKRLIVREGMGVVFEQPLWVTSKGSFLERIYGMVTAFEEDRGEGRDPRYPVNIQIKFHFKFHLSKENVPTWLLSKLRGSDLLQIGRILK
jgi:hypothetical protein